jgi:pyridoxal phosphate enzyme (YggS family)
VSGKRSPLPLSRANRTPSDVQLVAVSKTHPLRRCRKHWEQGQTIFGESRVQEAKAKIPFLPSRARWHFIGHLQKNKIGHALALGFELFHGIDSIGVAREMNRLAQSAGAFPHVLLEINVAGESTKFGFLAEDFGSRSGGTARARSPAIDGLMCLPPVVPEAGRCAQVFRYALRTLRDRLQAEFRLPLPQLSMGMSGDYPRRD